MGRGPAVQIEGARQLRASLRKCGSDLEDLKAAHAAVAAYVAAGAAARSPVRSGRLAGSVRGNKAKTAAIVRAGGASVPYAGVIHWGWPAHHIAARPFVSEAATSTEPVWLQMYFRDVEAAVNKIKGA